MVAARSSLFLVSEVPPLRCLVEEPLKSYWYIGMRVRLMWGFGCTQISYGNCPNIVPVCDNQQYRHYSGNRHYILRTLPDWLVPSVCSGFTGIIAGSRHSSGGYIEEALPATLRSSVSVELRACCNIYCNELTVPEHHSCMCCMCCMCTRPASGARTSNTFCKSGRFRVQEGLRVWCMRIIAVTSWDENLAHLDQ